MLKNKINGIKIRLFIYSFIAIIFPIIFTNPKSFLFSGLLFFIILIYFYILKIIIKNIEAIGQ